MSQVTNQLTGRQIDESNAVMSAYHGGFIRRQSAQIVSRIVDGQRTNDFVGDNLVVSTDMTGRNYLRNEMFKMSDFREYSAISGNESHAASLYETHVLPHLSELPESILNELTGLVAFLKGKTNGSNLNGEEVEFKGIRNQSSLYDSVYASNFEDTDEKLREYTTDRITYGEGNSAYCFASRMYKFEGTYYVVPTPLVVRMEYGRVIGLKSVTIRRMKSEMENAFAIEDRNGACLPNGYFGMPTLSSIDSYRIHYGASRLITEFNERNDYIINNADWRVGFELEKHDRGALANAHDAIVASGDTFNYVKRDYGEIIRRRVKGQAISLPSGAIVTIESDASLDSYSGFESVTTIYDLMSAEDELTEDMQSCTAFGHIVNAGTSGKCGGHITFSRKGLSTGELAEKLMPFMGLIYAIESRRLGNRYVYMKTKNGLMSGGEKYSPINLKSNGAIEIRLFSAVQSGTHLKNRVDLLKQIALLIDEGKTTSYLHVNQILRDTTSGLAKAVAKLVTDAEQVRMKALFFGTILENEGNVEDAKYGVFSKRMAKQVLQGYTLLGDDAKATSRRVFRKEYCDMV